ncbi:MAG: YraN family protein [Pseudomonadota bacterium]
MAFKEPLVRQRQRSGAQAHFRGACAEDSVARWYRAQGGDIIEYRWRGASGEIDLIIRQNGVVVFCEVKSSKNRERAIQSLSERQIACICAAAEEYVGALPDGQLTEMRFDFAIVGPDGMPEILQNAFCAH